MVLEVLLVKPWCQDFWFNHVSLAQYIYGKSLFFVATNGELAAREDAQPSFSEAACAQGIFVQILTGEDGAFVNFDKAVRTLLLKFIDLKCSTRPKGLPN